MDPEPDGLEAKATSRRHHALAEELGFTAPSVQWVRAAFRLSITPGAKDWDLNIQQFSITDERRGAVDFVPVLHDTPRPSSPGRHPAASATSIADLRDVLIGVQAEARRRSSSPPTPLEPRLSQKLQVFQLFRRLWSLAPADGPRGRNRR